ncbi:hypothetical protein KC345_g9610 [Hortaea werneckii]|nr:hypothetical protein KC345_g9610 [Hortaea werneckii]
MYNANLLALAFAATGALAQAPAQSTGSASSGASPAPLGPKVPGSNTLYYCSDPSDYHMTLSDVSINPLPPQPGSNVTLTINGELQKPITEGATHAVEFGKIESGKLAMIGSHKQDLCKNLDMIPDAIMKHFSNDGEVHKCPIEAGSFKKMRSHPVPKLPAVAGSALQGLDVPKPEGEFYVKASTTLGDGSTVMCVVADLPSTEGDMMSGN